MTDAEAAVRERVRLQAVTRFEGGEKNRDIAAALQVSERSVEPWRRQWRENGHAGVASKGSPGRARLPDVQIARLERELERGPLAHGWADQRWTLARVKTLIGRLFHVSYTVEASGPWSNATSAISPPALARSPPVRKAQAQNAAVPAGGDRRLPCGHWLDPQHVDGNGHLVMSAAWMPLLR
ncbi:transposase [Streptomyces sp. NPDC088846]|uniref:helix-turn-helix domain-containing protein n=1 Tax=Streptomyces sp. NPDC088846 TaxID=3365908 RepID=UPI0037F19FF3